MSIRIPTPDAPAAHHLTFICAVADLAHRTIERITGLQVSLQVSLYPINNRDRHAALVQAAADADLPYDQADDTGWHEWRSGNSYHIAAVTVFSHLPAEPAPESNAELRQIVTTEYEAAGGGIAAPLLSAAALQRTCAIIAQLGEWPEDHWQEIDSGYPGERVDLNLTNDNGQCRACLYPMSEDGHTDTGVWRDITANVENELALLRDATEGRR